jgi:hypothetical protein
MDNKQYIAYQEKPRDGAAPGLVTGQGTAGRIRIAIIVIFAVFLVIGLFVRGIAAAHAAAISFMEHAYSYSATLRSRPCSAKA